MVSAASLLIYNTQNEKKIENECSSVVKILEDEITENGIAENNNVENEKNYANNNYQKAEQDTGKIVNNTKYIGILYFPTISNLTVPVTENLNNENLKKGSCKYYGDIENNMVIGGHNYRCVFGKLDKFLKINDEVYFKDISGNVSKYRLKEKQTLNPSEVENLVHTSYDLTLFTCTYDNLNRIAFRFEHE